MASKTIAEKIAAGALILDVRTPEEFAEGAYVGAVNIPVTILPSKIQSLGEKDKPIIVYCASGSRSAIAQKILQASGYSSVTNAGSFYDMPV